MKKEFLKTAPEIKAWLDGMEIINYQLTNDKDYGFVVDVNNWVNLAFKEIDFIPVKFRHVSMSFYCQHNNLVSLDFCPKTVGLSLDLGYNQLKSLEGCPVEVGEDFLCQRNELSTLQHGPQKVGKNFYCHTNFLLSLEHCPQQVGGDFYCHNNPLLGNAQQISDFREIYRIHQEIIVKKEKSALLMDLDSHLNHNLLPEHTKNVHKI